jgi:hypothetical protein
MVVGFTTTYAIGVYHHYSCEFESHSVKVCSIQFVCDLRQVGCFLRTSTNKTDRHYVTEILLKVVLNTTTITLKTRLTIITFEFFYFIIHYRQQIKNHIIFTRSYIILHTIKNWKLRKSNNNKKKNLNKQ